MVARGVKALLRECSVAYNTMRARFNRSRSLCLLTSKLFELKPARNPSTATVT